MSPLQLTAAILSLAPELQAFASQLITAIAGAPTATAAARRVIILAGKRAILRA